MFWSHCVNVRIMRKGKCFWCRYVGTNQGQCPRGLHFKDHIISDEIQMNNHSHCSLSNLELWAWGPLGDIESSHLIAARIWIKEQREEERMKKKAENFWKEDEKIWQANKTCERCNTGTHVTSIKKSGAERSLDFRSKSISMQVKSRFGTDAKLWLRVHSLLQVAKNVSLSLRRSYNL